jgi:hypothetical protein
MVIFIEELLKDLVIKYVKEIGILKGEIEDPKLDFGFLFLYPDIRDLKGKPKGKTFSVVKVKKKNYIVLSHGTKIDGHHKKALVNLSDREKKQLFLNFQELFHSKELDFNINFDHLRFGLSRKIFLLENSFTLENFYIYVHKIFSTVMRAIIILEKNALEYQM